MTHGTATAHGAATIVNAIAIGKGAAFGVDLWTKAKVTITDEPKVIQGKIYSDLSENTLLIEKTVARVFAEFKIENQFGAKVETHSNIPIARGLKSSSTAANAVALATVAALGRSMDDLALVNLAVDAAFDAKVTVTGAFDDACASFFGGVVLTDNVKRNLIMRTSSPEGLAVLFHVPPKKAYTANSNVNMLKTVAPLVKIAYRGFTSVTGMEPFGVMSRMVSAFWRMAFILLPSTSASISIRGRNSVFVRPTLALRTLPSLVIMRTSSPALSSDRYRVLCSDPNVYIEIEPALTLKGRDAT
jgi:shikimate kinase